MTLPQLGTEQRYAILARHHRLGSALVRREPRPDVDHGLLGAWLARPGAVEPERFDRLALAEARRDDLVDLFGRHPQDGALVRFDVVQYRPTWSWFLLDPADDSERGPLTFEPAPPGPGE